MGTDFSMTIAGWQAGQPQLQDSRTSLGAPIDAGIAQLVQAMATYSANNPAFDANPATQVVSDPALQGVIAAAWHN
jgi:hypothetical protein